MAAAVASALPGARDVTVVDGGSSDGTVAAARSAGARVVTAARGRAVQMNEGARLASGDVLLFLHADTVLPAGYAERVAHALADPAAVLGAFDFLAHGSWRSSLVTFFANLRWRVMRFPYGDQAIFVRADTFRRVGGFPDLPVMEDWEFVRRAKRLGRVAVVPVPAPTSGRSWEEHGFTKAAAVNGAVVAGYVAGVDPARLARLRSRLAPHADAWRGRRREDREAPSDRL